VCTNDFEPICWISDVVSINASAQNTFVLAYDTVEAVFVQVNEDLGEKHENVLPFSKLMYAKKSAVRKCEDLMMIEVDNDYGVWCLDPCAIR
jgi:hypothetical protein